MSTLTFLGAARTVTGSKYLLEVGGRRLLVECGLFQGLKALRSLNWQSYLVHGEPTPMDLLKTSIEQQLGWSVRTPSLQETVTIP